LKFTLVAGVGAPARTDAPMLKVVADESTGEELSSALDEICRERARRMLAATLELEVDEYLAGLVGDVDESGRRLVVRNGHARPRTITTAAGAVEISAPRVNDRRVDVDAGERLRFQSAIVAPWCRKSLKVLEVLPLLDRHGLSSGDFARGAGRVLRFAGGPATVGDHKVRPPTGKTSSGRSMNRSLADRDLRVHLGRRGVHFNVRFQAACPS
jgi:hypothetical protein